MRDPKTDSLARGANELAIELERVVGMPVISRLAPAVALDPRAAPTRARRAPAVECLWVNTAPSQEIMRHDAMRLVDSYFRRPAQCSRLESRAVVVVELYLGGAHVVSDACGA